MLGDEWRICQLHVETIPEDWYTEGERPTEANPSRSLRMSGCERKSLLSNEGPVDSSALVLGHGNVEVDKVFSESGVSVTGDR